MQTFVRWAAIIRRKDYPPVSWDIRRLRSFCRTHFEYWTWRTSITVNSTALGDKTAKTWTVILDGNGTVTGYSATFNWWQLGLHINSGNKATIVMMEAFAIIRFYLSMSKLLMPLWKEHYLVLPAIQLYVAAALLLVSSPLIVIWTILPTWDSVSSDANPSVVFGLSVLP